MNARFTLNRRDAEVLGVAAGVADLTGVDVTLVRIGFVAATLFTGPAMLLLYMVAAWVAPER